MDKNWTFALCIALLYYCLQCSEILIRDDCLATCVRMYVYAYECVYVHYFIYKVLSVYSSQINTFTFVSFDVLFSHMPISVYVL